MLRRSPDPVRRRRLLRPGTLRTFSLLAFFIGSSVLLFAGLASAQSLSGGCTANVNGKDPTKMTKSKPVLVHTGESVSVGGTVPAAFQGLPPDQVVSSTDITISGIEGVVGVTSENHAGSGPTWGGSVNVDKYLKYGTGLYLVEATATGNGWRCSASGYVKLDGNPLSKPIAQVAVGFVALGGLGAAAASRPRPSGIPTAEQDRPTADDIKDDAARDFLGENPPPRFKPEADEQAKRRTCVAFLALVAAAFFGAAIMTVGATVAVPQPRKRIWAHGHPVLGVVSGLFLGIGIAVLGQQFAIWPLTILTAIVAPLWVALLGGISGYLGRPYRLVPAAAAAAPVAVAAAPVQAAAAPLESAPQVATPAAADAWTPTNVVPAEGLPAWAAPDPAAAPVATLDAGLPLQVVERAGDWAKVAASNGWTGWVDGRRLGPV